MTASEPAQPCPNGCVTKPTPELSAPSVGRGALPTGTPIPITQSGREQLAGEAEALLDSFRQEDLISVDE